MTGPAIGQAVHYHVEGADQPYAALVTWIAPTGRIHLTVFPPTGPPYQMPDVGPGTAAGQWTPLPPSDIDPDKLRLALRDAARIGAAGQEATGARG